MLEATTRASAQTPSRARQVRAIRVATLALAAIVSACGGSDPSKPFESLQSTAETARLTVRERLEGSVSERYAVDLLESLASTLPDVKREIEKARVRSELRFAGLTGLQQLSTIVQDARKPGASRAADVARLDSLASGLRTLARAAGAKED